MNLQLPVAIIALIAIAGLGGVARAWGRKSGGTTKSPLPEGCSRIHEFKNAEGSVVGVLYGRGRTPGPYSRLVIVDEDRETVPVLYEFESQDLHIEQLHPDRIVVSGGLTVQWHADTRQFASTHPR